MEESSTRSQYITTLSDLIENALTSEYDATRIYDGLMSEASQIALDSTTYNLIMAVVSDIRNEEEKHIGQLNELLKVINAQAAINIVSGEHEANDQMLPYIDSIQ